MSIILGIEENEEKITVIKKDNLVNISISTGQFFMQVDLDNDRFKELKKVINKIKLL